LKLLEYPVTRGARYRSKRDTEHFTTESAQA